MLIIYLLIHHILAAAGECVEFTGSTFTEIEIPAENCINIQSASFLSVPAFSCNITCDLTVQDSMFLASPSKEVNIEGPTSVVFSRNMFYSIKEASFDAIYANLASGSSLYQNYSSFIVSYRYSCNHIVGGDFTMENINITGLEHDVYITKLDGGVTFFRDSHESTNVRFCTFSKIQCEQCYGLNIVNSQGVSIKDTNFYQITSNGHATLNIKKDGSYATFDRVYFIKGQNKKTDWVYTDGFETSTFTDCVISDIDGLIGDITSATNSNLVSTSGATTIEIMHYKTWFMNADIPYSEKEPTPTRSLPPECPPLEPRASPRTIKRIITIASSLVAAASESI